MTINVNGDLEQALNECERACFTLMDQGASLNQILESLLLTAEVASGGGMVASILLVDDDGLCLRHGAAPNLPDAYCAAIDGVAIGEGVGSCGTAAHRGEPVIVSDIEVDPLWTDFRDLARAHMLRACWSTPIHDAEGRLIGTFAVYHHTPRSPTLEELGAIGLISRAAAVAIQRYRGVGPA